MRVRGVVCEIERIGVMEKLGRKSNLTLQKEKEIESKKQELLFLIENMDSKRIKVGAMLVENIAFMSVTLKYLRDHINRKGVKEEYKNGDNQFGYKESIESRQYNTIMKNYLSSIKQLNEMLPEDITITDDDEFNNFNK